MLELESGKVSYSEIKAGESQPFVLHLRENYTFKSSDVVAFVGDNGTGKSTLLNSITGYNEKIFEKKISAIWQHGGLGFPARDVVAYLEAHPSFLDIYSVIEYIRLSEYSRRSIANCLGREFQPLKDRDIEEIINCFNLKDLLPLSTGTLSSGQKVRLGLAMIQLQQSPFIVLDEPRSNLDKAGRDILDKLIKQWAESGKIVFLGTHDEKDEDLANRILRFEKNEVKEL